jgi:YqjK-like protein
MSERFDQLKARHDQLRLRSAIQRRELAQLSASIRQRLDRVDRGVNIVRGVVRKPLAIAAGFAILALLGPRRLLGLVTRSALVLTTAQRLARLAAPLSGRKAALAKPQQLLARKS